MPEILTRLQQLQAHYLQEKTRSYEWRAAQLHNLKAALYQHEETIYTALAADLKKSKEESWITEIGFVIAANRLYAPF